MASSTAVDPSSSEKRIKAVRGFWTRRAEHTEIDDVFLVLALIGEALQPLGVLDESQYHGTLSEVQTAVTSCGHAAIRKVFEKMTEELKYLVVAGLSLCAFFAPMHVYRGFGACVFNDWDWGCPDADHLERKIKKEGTSMFSRKPDPQPNRPVLLAFDRLIQVLQVKSVAFLSKRPFISGFAEQQPRYTPRPKKEIKEHLSLCEDWFHELEKRGHPAPTGSIVSSWGMPYASWTSQFSCQLTKDPGVVMLNQMDPGRLVHAFLCRGALNLHDGELMTLPPGTPAEALVCWLTGLPGMTHKIVSWASFDTANFEKKAGKKLCSKIGNYPLPAKYLLRDPSVPQTAIATPRLSVYTPAELASPELPSYSTLPEGPTTSDTINPLIPDGNDRSESQTIAELGDRSPVELDSRITLHRQMPVRHAATTPAPRREPPPPPLPPRSTSAAMQPERAATAPPSQPNHELQLSDSAAPPPRLPKVPLNSLLLPPMNDSSSSPSHMRSPSEPGNGDMSGHYLQLLNAVAKGHLSPQQLKEMLQVPTQQSQDIAAAPSYITAEPQELDSDPAPPEFMGVTIPRGEIRKEHLTTTANAVVHPSQEPRSSDGHGQYES